MMSEKILKLMNEQISKEMFASNLYLSMSAYFSDLNLAGFANWMRIQTKEENDHAMLIYDHLIERGAKVKILSVDTPQQTWKSPLEAISAAYEHEKYVTESIHKINTVALEEKDYPTTNFLQWFIKEQVEEEANTSELQGRLELAEKSPGAIFMIDSELKSRVYNPIDITQI